MPPTPQRRGSSNFTQQDGITLKEYVDLRFDQSQMALVLAERALKTHLDQLNEFKEALQDQTNTYVTRNELDLKLDRWISEYKIAHETVTKDIKSLQEFKIIIETKASQTSVVWAYVIAGIGILISLWDFFSEISK